MNTAEPSAAAEPRVFVVQATQHNIVAAQQHGEIVHLLPANEQLMFAPQPAVRRLREKLRDFGPRDLLLLVGDPAAIGVAVAVAADANHGRVKLLKYDRQTKSYYVVELDIFDRLAEPGQGV